jgi:predicted esterase
MNFPWFSIEKRPPGGTCLPPYDAATVTPGNLERFRRMTAGRQSRELLIHRQRGCLGRLRQRLHAVSALALVLGLATTMARGDRVQLADGRILEGRFSPLPGVIVDPLAAAQAGGGLGGPILMCDDELTRTMVAKKLVRNVEEAVVDPGLERIRIPQRVPDNGQQVGGVGGIVAVTPFDDYGRRVLTLATAAGRLDVVQGITEITPRWVRVEGIQTEHPLTIDMRLATSSLPRDALERVLAKLIDARDPDDRLRVVRLLMQADRLEDARRALDGVLTDFPELSSLAVERTTLARLAARRLLDEILLRAKAGQHQLATSILDGFPAADADGELLEEVREVRDRYRHDRERAVTIVAALRDHAAALEPTDAGAANGLIDEIQRELSFSALDRMATFERVGLDPDLPPDRCLAIAINGWLQGAAAGDGNLKVALSAARLRDLMRRYLTAADAPTREDILEQMRREEAFSAETLTALAAAMRPPVPPPTETAAGFYELKVPDPAGGAATSCLVQLPPEYDPLRRYPAVVTLNASSSSPQNQIEWWAGMPAADGVRQGQAARHGTIVIAPAWASPNHAAYGYSAPEHARVLAGLRAAIRSFSIDTDRVFLSGHSLGADAAWDIALAHPDLWAGIVLITPTAGSYVTHYWPNAERLPIYIVGGELDRGSLQHNATDLDRYFKKGFDATYVEYRGRGHEHFSDDILRIFDWMARKGRSFFPKEFAAVTLRPWDRFFWWLELEDAPPRTVVLPEAWPPATGQRPLTIEAKKTATNSLTVRCGAGRTRVWLSPELIDFAEPLTVTIDGKRVHRGAIAPDERVLLEDLRLRGDRQHPFQAVIETTKGGG